jgi:hypothetical protein
MAANRHTLGTLDGGSSWRPAVFFAGVLAGIIAASIDGVAAMLDDPARLPESRIFPCRVVERGTLRAPP